MSAPASAPGRPFAVLAALSGLLAACNALSGVDDFRFDGLASAASGVGGASTSSTLGASGAAGAPAGSGGAGGSATGSGGAGGGAMSAVCGDAVVDVDAGEHCDDGNTQGGDGCSATCTYELSDACPSMELHLGSVPVVLQGDTTFATAHATASCTGTAGKDYIFRVRAARSGTFQATLETAHVSVLWGRTDCPGGTELFCGDTMPNVATLAVQAGDSFFVGVDGKAGSVGPFTLTLVIQ